MSCKITYLILTALLYSCSKLNLATDLKTEGTLESPSDLTIEDFFDLPSIKDVNFSENQKEFVLKHVYPLYNEYLQQDTKQWCVNFSSKLSATSGNMSRILHLTRLPNRPNPRSYFEYHYVSLVVLDGQDYVVDGSADQFFDDRRGPIFMEKDKYLKFADSLGYELKNIKSHKTAVELYNFLFPNEQRN